MRDLGGSPRSLAAAAATLEARADRANALQARLIAARRLLLLGRLDEAAAALADLDARGLPPYAGGGGRAELRPSWHCARCASARREQRSPVRRRRPSAPACRRCWPRWRRRGPRSIVPPRGAFRPAASRRCGSTRSKRLLASGALVVDACRRGLRAGDAWQPLARRPVLFALARALAEAWPGDVDREALIALRVSHPPTRRDAPGAPARRDRPSARARHGAGAASRPPREASSSGRATRAMSSCWRRPSTAIRPRWWRCSPTARPGRPRPWRWPWGPASAPSSARSSSSKPPGGCARSGRARARRWLSPPLAGFTTILLLPAALPIE